MIFPVYAIRDQLNGFLQPMCEPSEGVAKRNFAYAMHNNSVMGFSPKDYDLYFIGSYDSDKGTISALDFPDLVVRGTETFLKQEVDLLE